MNTIDRIKALKAGEFDKVLEGTPYDANTHKETWGYSAYFKAGEHTWLQAAANVAKVEVTKAVLEEIERALIGACNTLEMNGIGAATGRDALDLLAQLRKEL
jgi:hypothetical protein